MAFQVKLKYLKISPRKVRLVADTIRGKRIDEAQTLLTFMVKKGADPISKLLNSAIANVKNNSKKETANLFITKITVDEGPTQKRIMPRAKGKADRIMKRSSHITLVLDEMRNPGGKKKGKKEKIAKVSEKIEKPELKEKKTKKTEKVKEIKKGK